MEFEWKNKKIEKETEGKRVVAGESENIWR